MAGAKKSIKQITETLEQMNQRKAEDYPKLVALLAAGEDCPAADILRIIEANSVSVDRLSFDVHIRAYEEAQRMFSDSLRETYCWKVEETKQRQALLAELKELEQKADALRSELKIEHGNYRVDNTTQVRRLVNEVLDTAKRNGSTNKILQQLKENVAATFSTQIQSMLSQNLQLKEKLQQLNDNETMATLGTLEIEIEKLTTQLSRLTEIAEMWQSYSGYAGENPVASESKPSVNVGVTTEMLARK